MPTKTALLSPRHLIFHTLRNLCMGIVLIIGALILGVSGYHYYEGMAWLDAFVSAAMILSGMGPTGALVTPEGKVFAGCYALFSGLFFILIIGLTFAPIVNHYFKKWHLEMNQ